MGEMTLAFGRYRRFDANDSEADPALSPFRFPGPTIGQDAERHILLGRRRLGFRRY
jgi:hypothetical protein